MKISIVTVCLNSEKTIEQTIQSVINQKDEDYEYIIIDGKSTDGTLGIIKKYEKNISTIVSEADDGVYDAMNKGIALATGDVIGIINSDDWYEPGVFAEVRKCFQELDAQVVHGRLNVIHENGDIQSHISSGSDRIRYEMDIYHPTVFIRKEIYEKYGLFRQEYKICADYELILRLFVNEVKFLYRDVAFANYRLGGISNQQGLKCAEETRMISQSYLIYVPLAQREHFKCMIFRKHGAFYFDVLLENYPDKMREILNRTLGIKKEEDIAIFGTGKWGMKAYTILRQSKMKPLFLVDNAKEKQGKNIEDVKIFPPEKLEYFKGTVLVLVKDFSQEIILQIKELLNMELYCIRWEEIATEFMRDFCYEMDK